MKAIKKSLCFALAVLSAAFTARAVDPVAVWSGFNQLESGTFTADISGAVPDATTGEVTLGSRGIKFANTGDAWAGSTKGFTVAVKYSNFSSGTAASLVSLQQNSETTATGIDKIGAWVNANGKVQGVWQGGAYGTANGTLPASGVVFVRYNDSNGTSVLLQNGTSLYAEGGLKSSNNNWGKSFAVGSFANGTSNVASGMTIEAVAIFDSRLSDSEIAAYTFPEPEPAAFETLTYEGFLTTTFVDTGWDFDLTKLDEYEITGMMSGSSIANRPASSTGYWIEPAVSATAVAKFQMQVYQYQKADDHWLKAVEVELKKGDNGNVWMRAVRTGYVDGGLTDPKGSIKITNWNGQLATSAEAGGYGVCKVMVKAPSGTVPRVIAMNFNKQAKNNNDAGGNASNEIGANENSGALDIALAGKAWNQLDGRSGSNYALDVYDVESDEMRDSDVKVAWSSANVYMWTNPTTKFLRGYLDDGGSGASVTVSSVPFGTYDVIIYMATDTESKSGAECRFAPVKINNKFYTWDATAGKVAEGETQWGASRSTTAVYGTNALRINGLSGATLSVQVPRKDITGSYGRGGIAAIEIIGEVPVDKTITREATISDDSPWSELGWDVAPTTSENAVLKVSAKSTLTLDDTTAFKSLKLIGSSDLTIAGLDSANIGLVSKINTSSFTGKLRFEIDASAGFTADDTLRNLIRTAADKLTFVFKGSGNKGAALDYGVTVNAAIHSHIVFDGGTHTMKYGYGGNGSDNNLFGVNATGANPTILVTGNAILNFTAKDISYWSGQSDIGGVIRVNDGATLNLLQNGSDTFFYRQRLWLDPGSQMTFNFSAKDQGAGTESCFRFHGGAVQNKEQIYVPESTTDMTSKPAVIKQLGTGALHLASDNTRGLAIFVGAKSKLRLETPITAGANDATVIKYGAGVLETTKSITVHPFTMTEGTFVSSSTINKLTIGLNVAFDISDGAPTITDTFSAQSKRLNLTIKEPTHMMDVITLPAGTDMTGWTAVVNGNTANPCELVTDGNTLKLKWKIPPTITVEADDVMIETADDWNGGVVKVGLGGLDVGDYEDEISYRLKFGDKLVTGSAANGVATFELSADEFTAGNIYRGTFELEYGTGNAPIAAAEVTVYAGEKTYGMKEGWINETTSAFKSTGVYDPAQGAEVAGDFIKFANPTDVVFTPTNSPADYVAKCDSEVTFEIFSGEEAIADDDDTVADDLQAGVKIVDDGSGGVKFQFISGDAWIDGPAATLNATYSVTVNFHYAKEEGDTDSVTYTVGETVLPCARRANVAEKLETISFADGTKIASLVGTCQIEVADPGMAPGAAEKELKATNEGDAQKEIENMHIQILVPSEVVGGLTEGLSADAAAKAKADYKAWFQVVAKPGEGGKWVASVVPTELAEESVEKEVQKVSTDVLAEVTALVEGTEGTATVVNAVPGFFYGVAEDGEIVNLKMPEPENVVWKMAGASGKIELKVTKPANAKARFYKVLCSPLPKTSK